jgi:hypothetical protein
LHVLKVPCQPGDHVGQGCQVRLQSLDLRAQGNSPRVLCFIIIVFMIAIGTIVMSALYIALGVKRRRVPLADPGHVALLNDAPTFAMQVLHKMPLHLAPVSQFGLGGQ